MTLLHKLLEHCPEGEIVDIRVGIHWTVVVAQIGEELSCGLASTLHSEEHHNHEPDVPDAGRLCGCSGHELAQWALRSEPLQASIGVATINALLPRQPVRWFYANAEQVIRKRGSGKKVVIIGHFPFVERIRDVVGELVVLERQPRAGDLPSEYASRVIPQAELVAITSMTIANHTLDELLSYCQKDAFVMLMGPSTPMHPVLFDYKVDLLSGSVVTDMERVLCAITEGGNFRQIHRAGVQLINMSRTGIEFEG